MEAVVSGHKVRIGKPGWFSAEELASAADRIGEIQQLGRTVMVIMVEGRAAGLAVVSDPVKSGSPRAVADLHRLGLKVSMLTGDNPRAAEAIAESIGIDTVFAEVLPEEKADTVKKARERGEMVGMVGDGINDAPALAQADVGIAIGTGTDVAIEAADVILSSGNLAGITRAVSISKKTMKTIRQNLFLAFVYNIILIPVAAGVLAPLEFMPMMLRQLHPILAALAMALSSISVVSNSLRLYKARIE